MKLSDWISIVAVCLSLAMAARTVLGERRAKKSAALAARQATRSIEAAERSAQAAEQSAVVAEKAAGRTEPSTACP